MNSVTTALQYFDDQHTCRCGRCFQSASHSSVTFGIIFGARLHPSSRQRSPADTRRTTIPTNCTGGFEENPWLHVETNINKVPQKWIDYLKKQHMHNGQHFWHNIRQNDSIEIFPLNPSTNGTPPLPRLYMQFPSMVLYLGIWGV